MYIVNAMNKYQQCILPDVKFTLKSAMLHVLDSRNPQEPYFFKKNENHETNYVRSYHRL
jgi:hypothetical protein